jgi:ankyrin repeat protein
MYNLLISGTDEEMFDYAKKIKDHQEIINIAGQYIKNGNLIYTKKMFDNFNIDMNQIYDFELFGEKTYNGISFLMLSTFGDNIKIVTYLLSIGADPNLKLGNGSQVLHEIVGKIGGLNSSMVSKLINNGADLNTLSADGLTLPIITLYKTPNNVKTLYKLLDAGSDVDKRWYNKKKLKGLISDGTLLIYCIYEDRIALAKTVLEVYGANPNIASSDAVFPIHYAVVSESPEMVSYLISAGADVNEQDGDGLTPLHYCAFYGDEEMAQIFIEHGAYSDLVDADGLTAFDYAIKNNKDNMLDILNPDDARMEAKRVFRIDVLDRLESMRLESRYVREGILDRAKTLAGKVGGAALDLAAAASPIGHIVKKGVDAGAAVKDDLSGGKKPVPEKKEKEDVKEPESKVSYEITSGDADTVLYIDRKKSIEIPSKVQFKHGKDTEEVNDKDDHKIDFIWNRYGWDVYQDDKKVGNLPERAFKK